MNTNSFGMVALVALLLTGVQKAVAYEKDPDSQPNIIFILTDDQGYGFLGCQGHPTLKTPHLDRMHEESVRFRQYHVSATCSPTRAALLTGRHPFYSGISHTIFERERMHRTQDLLGDVLKSGGYKTAIFGKWHLGDEELFQPQNRGFDEVFIHGGGGIGQTFTGTCGDVPDNEYFDPHIRHNGKFVKTKGYCTDVFFNQAMQWMKEEKKTNPTNPLFLYLSTNASHKPYIVGKEYGDMYKSMYETEETRNYHGMVSNIDDNVGKLLQFLNDERLSENTIVIFTSDNGSGSGAREETYNAGLRGRKSSMHEGGTNVPFIFYHQGRTSALDVDTLTMHWDILPTFADLGNVELPDGLKVDGRSIVPLMTEEWKEVAKQPEWANRFFINHRGRWDHGNMAASKYDGCAIRDQRWRLVDNTKLYDLPADRGEDHNVIDQHPEVVARMRAKFDAWWDDATPHLVNEGARVDPATPKLNTYKADFWKQHNSRPEDISSYIKSTSLDGKRSRKGKKKKR